MATEPTEPEVEVEPTEPVEPGAEAPDDEPDAEPAPEPEQKADDAPWYGGAVKLMDEALGADPGDEKAYRDLIGKLKPDDIRDMPPAAQAVIRAARQALRAEAEATGKTIKEREDALAAKERAAEQAAAKFAREQAALTAIFDSPEIRALRGAKPQDKPDLRTEEGRKAYLDSVARSAAGEAFAPVIERATKIQQQSAYLALRETYPELKDPAFEQRVVKELRDREAGGTPIDTETAVQILQARDLKARLATEADAARRARAEGARAISRATSPTGGRPAPKGPPADVIRNGQLAKWLRENPDYNV